MRSSPQLMKELDENSPRPPPGPEVSTLSQRLSQPGDSLYSETGHRHSGTRDSVQHVTPPSMSVHPAPEAGRPGA